MWTAASAAVFLPLVGLIILACFASTLLVGKWRGWTKISVKLFGLGYTIERYNVDQPGEPIEPPALSLAEPSLEPKAAVASIENGLEQIPDPPVLAQQSVDRSPPIEEGGDLAEKP
jgi:hypothetical protein